MPYKFLPHTADVRLTVRGRSLEELFAEALRGMMEMVKPRAKTEKPMVRRSVALRANDATALLVDFLNNALLLSTLNKEIYTRAAFRELTETSLRGELTGGKVGAFDKDVKAVTYHEAAVKQNARGEWETTLVLDI